MESPSGQAGARCETRRSIAIAHVLVIDADLSEAEGMKRPLEEAGLEVRLAGSGRDALAAAHANPPDLAVVEMLLPDLSGLGLVRAMREDPQLVRVPIVMVAATAAEMDRVVAFEVGVDDFVSKPFHPRELALRVSAILRRTLRGSRGERPTLPLRFEELELDASLRSVHVDGRAVRLTAKEFDVLAVLMRGAGRVLGRKQILDEVWGVACGKTVRVVDTHVKWIRRKIEPAGRYIETLRGVGYRFTDRSEEALGE
ncbi:MAG TPA: response regulator transcription factor [Myxococcota bacterium]|jgi:two-component system phosphate regulon response regulator PhoB|nr:response regulator transcription factor [Myxococcota bacterium]